MTRLAAIIVAAALGTGAIGFIEGKPEGAEFRPEMSQRERAEQQRLQGSQDIVGEVPTDTEPEAVPEAVSDPGSAVSFGRAADQRDRKSLDESAKRRGPGPNPNRAPWLLLLGIGVGAGALFAVRQYANRVVPEPPGTKRDRRSF
jgi:hypothetical protein